jgi:hypothetical protein
MSRRVHPTEQQLGYYRKYRTRHGDTLRFIRMQAHPLEEPEVDDRGYASVWHFLGLVIWVTVAVAVMAYGLPVVLLGLFGPAT